MVSEVMEGSGPLEKKIRHMYGHNTRKSVDFNEMNLNKKDNTEGELINDIKVSLSEKYQGDELR